MTEPIKARGYCAKLPEDKRVNVEQLLWSFCCYPREKGAGTGFPSPVRAGSCPATPEHLPQTSLLPIHAGKPPRGLPKMIWPHTEVWRSIPEAETLLCSKHRHPPVPAQGTSAQQRPRSARALVLPESLWGAWERQLESSIGVHSTPVSPHSRVCFQHILPKCIMAPGTEISCHLTALQLLMFTSVPSANLPEHSLPLTLAVSVCGFSIILMFWYPSDYVSVMAWFYYLNK